MLYEGSRGRFKEMLYSEWYEIYLMTYFRIIEHPRYTKEKRHKYINLLLSWYENDELSYMENYLVER